MKNAYDADARRCTIELVDTHEIGGTVTVTDDGSGMTAEIIENGWLILGRSSKSVQQPTPEFGRMPAGNKGLGRLASLRLGTHALLLSRPKSEPGFEYELEIAWSDFDGVDVVEDVTLHIKKKKRSPKAKDGTEINVRGLRSKIGRMDVKRLARGMLLLADPFDDNPAGFRPVLKAPEFKELEKLVQQRYFDDAEFHLVAEVNDNGIATATVIDWKGQVLFAATHVDISRKSGESPYLCPSARFDLWAFILDKETFSSRSTSKSEVQDWLKEFGGVHLYVRGLRVAPYGNPGNDWLDMNLSRARSPELRPSTNTAIGRVAVSDRTGKLFQKTDRTGIVEDDTFLELKRFATDALDWMARQRKSERDNRRTKERVDTPKKVGASKEIVKQAIAALPAAIKEEVEESFQNYDRARENESRALRSEVQLYRTLSTAGITAAVFAHESKQPLKLIVQNTGIVQRRAKEQLGNKYQDTLADPLSRILRQAEVLQGFGSLTLSLVDHEKRRAGRVEIHPVIEAVLEMFNPFVGPRHVQAMPRFAEANPFLRASNAAIESIMTNLLANSLKAFEEASAGERRIVIATAVDDGWLTIRAMDNGPGIQGLNVEDIWLPGETTYPNGTGLGLTIVRDTVNDLGGSVSAIAHGELGGAEIIINIPILGA